MPTIPALPGLTATQAASRARRVAEGARTRFAIHAERGEALAEERAHQLPVPRARLRVVDLERRAVVPVRPRDSALLCFLADGASPRDARGGVGLIDCPGTGGSPGKGAATCLRHAVRGVDGTARRRRPRIPRVRRRFSEIDRRRSTFQATQRPTDPMGSEGALFRAPDRAPVNRAPPPRRLPSTLTDGTSRPVKTRVPSVTLSGDIVSPWPVLLATGRWSPSPLQQNFHRTQEGSTRRGCVDSWVRFRARPLPTRCPRPATGATA